MVEVLAVHIGVKVQMASPASTWGQEEKGKASWRQEDASCASAFTCKILWLRLANFYTTDVLPLLGFSGVYLIN